LGITQHPDLNDRLKTAQAAVQKFKYEQEERRQKKHAEIIAKPKPKKLRRLYPLGDLPNLNAPVRLSADRVVVFEGTGRQFRIGENHPSYEGSHLLGHEGEQGCYCYYREATEDEIATLERHEADEKAKRVRNTNRRATLAGIREAIQKNGEVPAGTHSPEGQRYHDTQNIYGGGDWFVVGPEWIWYVRNNGMDGDDWSRNNVRTGGAGAIGWRVKFDEKLSDEIIELEE
jgi:hypothetical protein